MSLDSDQAQLNLNDCGCCEGLSVETPLAIVNRPGLSAIAYRVGTHARFKASMLARLSDSGLPELGNLKTRDDDDFTIALLDAWSLTADVLTFYQERIANESYLRTATERTSLIHLARLIGYELRPGVAASTYLAFTLENAAGAPAAVTLDTGLKVQSIPGPGEKPQTFETVEQVAARGEWNEMRPRLTELRIPAFGSISTYLEGVTTTLKKGDMLLFVGEERAGDVGSERWDIRRVAVVEPDAENQRTFVRWSEPLGSVVPRVEPGQRQLQIYAMRLRASIFGYNAPDWHTLPVALRVGEANPKPNDARNPDPNYKSFLEGAYANQENSWADKKFEPPRGNTSFINLDSVYSQIVLNSWIVLTRPESGDESAYGELYRVRAVGEESKSAFNITGKTTRLEISGENIDKFSPRNATVHAQSEEVQLAETPITEPVWKDVIVLDQLVEPLAAGRKIIVTGKRLRVRVEKSRKKFALVSLDDPSSSKQLNAGDELIVLALPLETSAAGVDMLHWQVMDESGFVGFVDAPEDKLTLVAAAKEDDVVSEVATVEETTNEDDTHTRLKLTASLANVFDRPTVKINANVALATHGETVADEVLGSGDAGQPYQRFTLKQSPLTYTSADTPSGGLSTLQVFVNRIRWHEVPTLYGHGPRERIYVTSTDDDKKTTVQFGDGELGARLPMGSENVQATYRKGIGLEGLVDAGQLSLLMTRPLGVKGVTNPQPASGAQDPQSLDDARTNAPLTVLTLDRIVSLRDYEDFARSFSGIAKALATWTWNVHTRGVFVTVAGIDGAAVADDSALRNSLVSAMQKSGDAQIPVTLKSYRGMTFKLVADVKVDADHIEQDVLAAVEAALRASFSFTARAFGQPVTLSEVMAVMQSVAGVVAVDINKLHRSDEAEALNSFLTARAPQPGDDAQVLPAELLTLDPLPLELGVMP
ncbi:MAG TPA: putative baseplate assembly protein [Pyrinomonadaceae bacterium]|nr:putative baseplate assembly protein [Pyrinomonadaceae bacterium]